MKSALEKLEIRDLLLECFERQNEIVARPLPDPRCFSSWKERDALLRKHGPEFSTVDWFGLSEPREKMRYVRAVQQCERQGWIETWRQWDGYLTNIKLTPAGLAVAKELAAQQVRYVEDDDQGNN